MKSKQILFFLPKKTMNEATSYYVNILKKSFEKAGFEILESENFKDVKKFNNIFVMSAKWCFLVKLFNPNSKVITWFQGVGGEEALMIRGSKRDKLLWNCVELFSLKFSYLNIFVSERMQKFYKTYNKSYFIMPCFNKALNQKSFLVSEKYNNLSFVYAGGLDKWQCIEKTLEFFKKIEEKYPQASLTLLTKSYDEASALLKHFKIKNGDVKFVKLEDLDNELSNYKYGFLIRDDHIVNNVSTPTKMNSYLANGIIPIFTNVIDDFNINLNSKYFLILDKKRNIEMWVDDFSNHEIFIKADMSEFYTDISNIFSSYYSEERYIELLSNKISYLSSMDV